jgi:peptidoglycan/xylan/chitin deacetylase (PgdA/CDA1 family)
MLYYAFLSISRRKPQRIVIYYHALKHQDLEKFERQMTYLATKCRTVNASNIKNVSANGSKMLVAITFDDAFISITENAVPVLKKLGLPACIFVPAGNLGQPPRWEMPENYPDKNETVMSQEQIMTIDRDGFEIFSHSLSHPVMTELDNDRVQNELTQSKQALEKIVGHQVLGVSYPYGVHNADVLQAAQRAGYQFGFTIEPYSVDTSPDNFQIGRFKVSPEDSMLKFKLKVNGAYEVVKYLRSMKKRLSRHSN